MNVEHWMKGLRPHDSQNGIKDLAEILHQEIEETLRKHDNALNFIYFV
jgi:hypothetical protein